MTVRTLVLSLAIGVGCALSISAFADAKDFPTADVALVLAADVSASMKEDEIDFQRQAYANALVHGDIWSAVEEGPHGRILLAYMEWSSCSYQQVVVNWTVIDDPGDLQAVAATILAAPARPYDGVTCIGSALVTAASLLKSAPEIAERKVVDVSGDGTDNAGGIDFILRTRDALIAAGVTINGLPILHGDSDHDVAGFYQRVVVGGPAAFLIPIKSLHDLEPALRRKLVQEIG